jgi:hypothetical protein
MDIVVKLKKKVAMKWPCISDVEIRNFDKIFWWSRLRQREMDCSALGSYSMTHLAFINFFASESRQVLGQRLWYRCCYLVFFDKWELVDWSLTGVSQALPQCSFPNHKSGVDYPVVKPRPPRSDACI